VSSFLNESRVPAETDRRSASMGALQRKSKYEHVPIEELYEAAFVEGEGIGTAYEYLVKWRVLLQLFKHQIRNIIVLGLPEKYGASMDFVLLADYQGCGVTIVDDRCKSVLKCRDVLREMNERGLIHKIPKVIEVDDLLNRQERNGVFDLAVSCEVLQRVAPLKRRDYIMNSLSIARYAAVFVPNKANGSHAKVSKLEAIELDDLHNLFKGYRIVDEGYVDMPPFPPGLKRRSKNTGRGSYRHLQDKVIVRLLDGWSKVERFSTGFKARKSHIAFVMAGEPPN